MSEQYINIDCPIVQDNYMCPMNIADESVFEEFEQMVTGYNQYDSHYAMNRLYDSHLTIEEAYALVVQLKRSTDEVRKDVLIKHLLDILSSHGDLY